MFGGVRFMLAEQQSTIKESSILAEKTMILAEIGIVIALLVIGGVVEMYMS